MAHLAKLIGGLGIGNDDHVVVIPAGASAVDMGTATRVYWTFKVLGHEEVSILNGGNRAYMKDKKNPLETGMSKPEGTTFKVAMNTKYLATEEDVRAAVKGGAALLDSRSQSQFMGMNKSGKVQKAGTLPGAVSVPGEWMTVNGGGQIRSGQALKKLYAMTEAPTEGAAITFCNTGHWASLGWFVNSEVLGNKNTKMYDGSMAEYTTDPSVEMDRKVNLD
jgi:thiosulfate/3-mercaptopyruvate sulfurtransferase